MTDAKLPSRRWGPFRQEFYSVCSCHRANDLACNLCGQGTWINVWRQRIGHFIFARLPRLWRWRANFPSPKLKLEPRDHTALLAQHDGPDVIGNPDRTDRTR